MKDILYGVKLNKGIKKVARLKAEIYALKSELEDKEKEIIKQFYLEMDSEVLYQIFELIEKRGIQFDKNKVKKIKEKYENKKLKHDDIVVLDDLYKSNAKYFSKEEENG